MVHVWFLEYCHVRTVRLQFANLTKILNMDKSTFRAWVLREVPELQQKQYVDDSKLSQLHLNVVDLIDNQSKAAALAELRRRLL